MFWIELHSLYTFDSDTIRKFSDNTVDIAVVTENSKKTYLKEVENLIH